MKAFMKTRKMATLVAGCAAAIIGAYVIFVGIIGGHEYSSSPKSWESFSSYINNMMTPLLAFIAAIAAINSISESKRQANSNSEINNCLRHIEIIRQIIDKRWASICEIGGIDWESKASQEIDCINFPAHFASQSAMLSETLNLGLSLQSLSEAVQWYAHLHKRNISPVTAVSHPRNEWARFPTSLLEEQAKKMKFCYVLLMWRNKKSAIPQEHASEALFYQSFYEGLIASTTIRKE